MGRVTLSVICNGLVSWQWLNKCTKLPPLQMEPKTTTCVALARKFEPHEFVVPVLRQDNGMMHMLLARDSGN